MNSKHAKFVTDSAGLDSRPDICSSWRKDGLYPYDRRLRVAVYRCAAVMYIVAILIAKMGPSCRCGSPPFPW